jgi:fructose-1,6-bisphosphatase/inositol monophosphatase family enzyme
VPGRPADARTAGLKRGLPSAGGFLVTDLDTVAALVQEVAAQVHLPLFGQAVSGEEKSPGELVSQADRAAETLLLQGLAEITPGLAVIGEEAAHEDPSLLAALSGEAPVWLVDPLDGTREFLDGSPDHAIMLALVRQGRPVCALVHQPQHDRTYTAELGSGTWRDGVRLRRDPAPPNDLARLRGGVLRRFLNADARRSVEANEGRFGDLTPRTSCAGVEYPRIVEGDADFLLFWRTLPWDHAPGSLLLTEAGGTAVRPDGTAYLANDDRSGLLAASDDEIAQAVLAGLGLTSTYVHLSSMRKRGSRRLAAACGATDPSNRAPSRGGLTPLAGSPSGSVPNARSHRVSAPQRGKRHQPCPAAPREHVRRGTRSSARQGSHTGSCGPSPPPRWHRRAPAPL